MREVAYLSLINTALQLRIVCTLAYTENKIIDGRRANYLIY